jgi:hypothetical protein
MAITAAFENSATISTSEYSLPANTTTGVPTSQTDDGVYQVFLDLNALTATEQYRLRVYEKVQAAGTQRVLYEAYYYGAQGTPLVALPSLILLHGWDITLLKVSGTDRAIPWSIRKVA